jgi:hypothetical protein
MDDQTPTDHRGTTTGARIGLINYVDRAYDEELVTVFAEPEKVALVKRLKSLQLKHLETTVR